MDGAKPPDYRRQADRDKRLDMKEWQRTAALLVLLAAAVGYLVWAHYAYDVNLVQFLPR